MNFAWAIQQMKEGRKVRRKNFAIAHWYLDDESKDIMCHAPGCRDAHAVVYYLPHIEADDWELIGNPNQFIECEKRS